MKELGEKIVSYWGTRAEGYSEYNREELAGDKWQDWIAEIKKTITEKRKIGNPDLDIGTSRFFAILLAQEGYQVTAIDCTAEMLAEAQANAGALAAQITWKLMDAQKLEFADESFDLVLSRNLTWVLEEPEMAYAEWYRVLKPEGIMLNFDANWYRYLYDEEMRKGYEADRAATEANQVRDEYINTDIDAMEEIAKNVPLSRKLRPEWDREVLQHIGFSNIDMDTDIWQQLWTEDEKVNFASTPMFRIAAMR
mgnify:CR=1 FL=1